MAEKNKMTSVEQFKMLALRSQADSVARIAELAGLIADGYSRLFPVLLPAGGWIDGKQTVEHETFLAGCGYCYFAYGRPGVYATDVTQDGQIVFQCEDTLDVDLTVYVVRMEVEAEGTVAEESGKVFNLAGSERIKEYVDERFGDFYDALINERPIYFGLCDSDSKALLDSEGKGVAGRVIFQIK